MSATLQLLDRWKVAKGIDSDNAAALTLGLTRSAVSEWRQNNVQGRPGVISRMARDLGEDPGAWMALVESERARTDADRKAWAALARRLGAAAALAVALLPMGNVHASPGLTPERSDALYIMRNVLRRLLARTRANWAAVRSFHGSPAVLA